MSTRASGRASRPLLKRDPRQYDQSGPYRFSSRCRRTPTPATETKIPTGISTVSAVRLPLRGHLGSRLAVGCGPGVAVSVTVTVGPGTVLVTVTAGRPVLGQATSPRAFGSAVRWHWTCMGAFFLAQRESRHKWWDPCAAAGSLRRRNPPCAFQRNRWSVLRALGPGSGLGHQALAGPVCLLVVRVGATGWTVGARLRRPRAVSQATLGV